MKARGELAVSLLQGVAALDQFSDEARLFHNLFSREPLIWRWWGGRSVDTIDRRLSGLSVVLATRRCLLLCEAPSQVRGEKCRH